MPAGQKLVLALPAIDNDDLDAYAALDNANKTVQPVVVVGEGVDAYRGGFTSGLKHRVLGRATYQVTGGTGSSDTFEPKVNGVALVTAPVEWETSHSNTAKKIAVAINDNRANHNYVAIYSTDTVTVYQRTSGAITGDLTVTTAGAAAGTLSNFANTVDGTDTYTTIHSGDTFGSAEYFELFYDSSLIDDNADATNAKILDLVMDNADAWNYWTGGLHANAADPTAILKGPPVAADSQETIEWLEAGGRLIVKLDSDVASRYKLRYM